MKLLLSLLTKENITFLIAVIGFLLSLYNFLENYCIIVCFYALFTKTT